MMRIHYLSDVHLERYPLRATCLVRMQPVRQRALFIAGDLGNPYHESFRSFLYTACDLWQDVFYVPGNHEYDAAHSVCGGMNAIDDHIERISFHRHNLHVLREGRVFPLGKDYLVTGSTLWAYQTSTRNNNKQTTTTERHERYLSEVNALDKTLCTIPSHHPHHSVIVMTHYLPSYCLIQDRFLHTSRYASRLDHWASRSDHLMRPPVKYWIAGHTHTRQNQLVHGVRVLINGQPTHQIPSMLLPTTE